jgi:hypothetical protein
MMIEKRTRTWDSTNSKKPSHMLYIESLGEYAEPLTKYILAQNKKQKTKAAKVIKLLFDSNPMFYSKGKGSVLQYLQYFPDDKILQEWAAIASGRFLGDHNERSINLCSSL